MNLRGSGRITLGPYPHRLGSFDIGETKVKGIASGSTSGHCSSHGFDGLEEILVVVVQRGFTGGAYFLTDRQGVLIAPQIKDLGARRDLQFESLKILHRGPDARILAAIGKDDNDTSCRHRIPTIKDLLIDTGDGIPERGGSIRTILQEGERGDLR